MAERPGPSNGKRKDPLFALNLGLMSCYCVHSAKAGDKATELEEELGEPERYDGQPGLNRGRSRKFDRAASGLEAENGSSAATGHTPKHGEVIARHPADDAGQPSTGNTILASVQRVLHFPSGPAASSGARSHQAHNSRQKPAKEEPPAFLPFVSAVLSGKYVEAYRMLQNMEGKTDPNALIRKEALQRIRRVGEAFERSMKELKWPAPNTVVVQERIGGQGFCVTVSNGLLHVLSVSSHQGDPLNAFAAVCEVDVCRTVGCIEACSPVQVQASVVGTQRCEENLWHLERQAERSDFVLQVHCANALLESQPGLWVSLASVPSKGSLALPPEKPGCKRQCPKDRAIVRIQPLPASTPTSSSSAASTTAGPGYRLTVLRVMEISNVAYLRLRLAPPCLRARRFRREVDRFTKHFEAVTLSPAVEERIRSSPARADFYKQIQRQLETKSITPWRADSMSLALVA